MSADLRREWAALVNAAWQLYRRYLLLGFNRVAPPYVGELAVVAATLPAEDTLVGLSARLLDAARAGSRLLDQSTPWWSWCNPAGAAPLVAAIAEARGLAGVITEVARTVPGEGPRDRGTPIFGRVASVLAAVYSAASTLYEGKRPKSEGEERSVGVSEPMEAPRAKGSGLFWLVALGGIGYLGTKWLASGKKKYVAGNATPGYHPGVGQSGEKDESEQSNEGRRT
jgi:hypothetical protein